LKRLDEESIAPALLAVNTWNVRSGFGLPAFAQPLKQGLFPGNLADQAMSLGQAALDEEVLIHLLPNARRKRSPDILEYLGHDRLVGDHHLQWFITFPTNVVQAFAQGFTDSGYGSRHSWFMRHKVPRKYKETPRDWGV